MRFVIVAGGTGGHFYPGLAVAKNLQAKGHEVHFIVRTNDYVIPLLQREGFPFSTIAAAGLQRRFDPRNILLPFKLASGFISSRLHLKTIQPDALLVMGGYLSVMPSFAAMGMKIPIVLHEQNVIPGLANRMISRLAAKVAVSFPASQAIFGKNAVLTGNPVRSEISSTIKSSSAKEKFGLKPDAPVLLVVGGSLGSRPLNALVMKAVSAAASSLSKLQILHFTGKTDEPVVRSFYEKNSFLHSVSDYCHDMPAAYAAADLILCRAGASTVTELICIKKPAILIPFPQATANHQVANAKILSDVGAAELREERLLKEGELGGLLIQLFKDPARMDAMKRAYGKIQLDPLAATEKIADLLTSLA